MAEGKHQVHLHSRLTFDGLGVHRESITHPRNKLLTQQASMTQHLPAANQFSRRDPRLNIYRSSTVSILHIRRQLTRSTQPHSACTHPLEQRRRQPLLELRFHRQISSYAKSICKHDRKLTRQSINSSREHPTAPHVIRTARPRVSQPSTAPPQHVCRRRSGRTGNAFKRKADVNNRTGPPVRQSTSL